MLIIKLIHRNVAISLLVADARHALSTSSPAPVKRSILASRQFTTIGLQTVFKRSSRSDRRGSILSCGTHRRCCSIKDTTVFSKSTMHSEKIWNCFMLWYEGVSARLQPKHGTLYQTMSGWLINWKLSDPV